jgi:hypothetical protein
MQNEQVVANSFLIKSVQMAFSLSIVQFSFSVAATQQRNAQLKGLLNFLNLILSTDAWALLLAMLTQELPSFIVRLVLIVHLASTPTYSLYFFAIKNAIMMALYVYRIGSLIFREYTSSKVNAI